MRDLVLIICFLFIKTTYAQNVEDDILQKKYTVAQILEDIDYTHKYLVKFHPDPYRYIAKDSLDIFVKRIKTLIDTPLTEMQVRFYIRQIITKIGCGHTDAIGSKAYVKKLNKISRSVLPINVFIDKQQKMYVYNNLTGDTTIANGDEILGLGKHKSKSILKSIYSIYSSDGYNLTQKTEALNYDWFKYFYSFCYGFKPAYPITIKHKNGVITSYTLAGIESKKDTVIFPKRDTIIAIQSIKTCNYGISKQDSNLAIIDINAFRGWHWRRFLRRSFADINKKQVPNLVIDLRNNSGGEIIKGLKMLSYIIPEKVVVPIDGKPNLLGLNPRLKSGFAVRFTQLVIFNLMPSWPKHGRWRHYFVAYPKKKKAYKGKVFVLVNGKSFSMSCVAASYLKYKTNAKIIGTETGGNVSGSNAALSGKLVLPNTHVRVVVPLYHIYHTINTTNKGYGVMPDYETNYSIDDALKGSDVDLQKVLELIKIN